MSRPATDAEALDAEIDAALTTLRRRYGTPRKPAEYHVGDRVYVARANERQQCVYSGARVGTVDRVIKPGEFYDVVLDGFSRVWYEHDQLDPWPGWR